MIKNYLEKQRQINFYEKMIENTKKHIEHLEIMQHASTEDLICAQKHILNKITSIQNKQKIRAENKNFHGLLHWAGKKIVCASLYNIEKVQLLQMTQSLTYIKKTLIARQEKTHLNTIPNFEAQLDYFYKKLAEIKKQKLNDLYTTNEHEKGY